MKKTSTILCVISAISLSFGLVSCNDEKRYSLTINGSDLLYENLNKTYVAGEEVMVKTRIIPYEGVKVALDTKPLVKTKSTQNEYWQFTFKMPSHNATLDITSYKGFDEPLLYGFHLTFNDKNGEPIEAFNKPVDSGEAIADYAMVYYEDNHKVVSSNSGANVFADSKQKISNVGYEPEDTLYYTYELVDAVVVVDWVYVDEITTKVYSYGNEAGYKLNNLGGLISTFAKQNLSDTRYTAQMKEYEENFDSFVKINFAYLDYLTGVKVLEYNNNNELIKSTNIKKSDSEITYVASETCEYVVIEEEYTIKNGENNGKTYTERCLINKKDDKFGDGKMLKFPRGDGLISPTYLSIKNKSKA